MDINPCPYLSGESLWGLIKNSVCCRGINLGHLCWISELIWSVTFCSELQLKWAVGAGVQPTVACLGQGRFCKA